MKAATKPLRASTLDLMSTPSIRFATFSVQLRLPGSSSIREKNRVFNLIKNYWGSQTSVALKEIAFFEKSHHLGLMFIFFGKNDRALDMNSDEILKWFDDNVEGWVEEQLLEKY
jgi:hypothetical protein